MMSAGSAVAGRSPPTSGWCRRKGARASGSVAGHSRRRGTTVLEDIDDVGGRSPRLLDPGSDVLAEAVVGHTAVDAHLQLRHVGKLHRVVGNGEDRLGQVQ